MTVGDWVSNAESKLAQTGVSTPLLDARVIAETVLSKPRSWLIAHSNDEVMAKDLKRLDSLLKKRLARQPLAYIVGHKEFFGLDFSVTPDVLIPRPETEVLVERAIKTAPQKSQVLEVGTGSGCIAVALKKNRPDLSVTAVDVSQPALAVARRNAKLNRVEIELVLSDLFKEISGRFDLVLANLPYVPEGVRRMAELDFEPQVALYGGVDGLDVYRQFFAELAGRLRTRGKAIIETGPTQRQAVISLAISFGFMVESISEYVSIIGRKR